MKFNFEYHGENYDFDVIIEKQLNSYSIISTNKEISMKSEVMFQENGDIRILKPVSFILKDPKIQISDYVIKVFVKATRIASVLTNFPELSVADAKNLIDLFGDEVAINCSALNMKFCMEIH
jgi:hypothetical protein